MGKIPRSMVVVLEDDLVDSCKSGEKMKLNHRLVLRFPVRTHFWRDDAVHAHTDRFGCGRRYCVFSI